MLSTILIAIMSLASMSYVSCGETAQETTQSNDSQEIGQWSNPGCAILDEMIKKDGTPDSFREFIITADDKKINPATCNRDGYTLMHTAALYDRYSAGIPLTLAFFTKVCKMDVNARDKDTGSTPLHMATIIGNAHTVNFLLENGADPLIKNNLGTAYENAKRWSRFARDQELCKNFERVIEKLEKAEDIARLKKRII